MSPATATSATPTARSPRASAISCTAAASALAGSACFAPAPLVARLVCPLAAGADQIAAAATLAQGCALHAVLPFGRDDYRADFAP